MLDNGDCTLIRTTEKKNILIDTGEEKNIVLEYLLDRKIKEIDYLMISHFDSDHCRKATDIIENLRVKNIVISKQVESSQEFLNILEIVNKKRINIIQVQAGDIIKIDKDVYFQILWPDNKEFIRENPLNNNSIVAKMYYKSFSILFTGDIEKLAEEKILKKYSKDVIKSTVLKTAHHGSATSSTKELVENVFPQIALIGAGQNNKFGHPNNQTIQTLEDYGVKTYRTDLNGEITLTVNKNGKIKIQTQIN